MVCPVSLIVSPENRWSASRKAGAAGAAAEDGEDAAISGRGQHGANVRAASAGYDKAGCVASMRSGILPLLFNRGGGAAQTGRQCPVSVYPDTGFLYVPGTIRSSVFARVPSEWRNGIRYTNGTQSPPVGSRFAGTFTAIDATTNKIAWQQQMPYRMGGGGGSTVTAGGLSPAPWPLPRGSSSMH